MAAKKKTTKSKKKLDVKVRMIGELIDVTGSSKDSWNPAEISDDMKAISYIRKLADSWNTAQLNEALKYLGFKTVDTWNAAELEETKNKLVKYFLPTEATGNPITLNAYGNLPYEVSKAEVTFLPKQDLHGYDSPWVGGAGKNKLQVTMASSTSQGITATVYDDGTILVNGTATGLCAFTLNRTLVLNGNYILSGCPSGGSSGTFRMDCYWTGQGALIDSGNGVAISPNGNVLTVRIVVMEGFTINNLLFKPMIRLATETDATFAPYENICPISGWTEVNLYVDEEQTATPETTYTETLGATYYGGKVDFVSGEGSEEWDYIASYDGETLPGEWISDRDAYAPGTTPTTGAEVAYKLSEAAELTLTPQEIELLKGQNVIWTDGDNINITYKAILN